MDKYFLLFSNCIPVSGAKRAIICDLQNSTFISIPLEFYELLDLVRTRKYTVSEIKEHYENKVNEGIDTFFNYLISKGVGMYTSDVQPFPELDMRWSFPGSISNAIIEVAAQPVIENFKSCISQLSTLGCFALELRLWGKMQKNDIITLLDCADNSSIRHISIISGFYKDIDYEDFFPIFNEKPRCGNIVVMGSPFNKQTGRLSFTTSPLANESCGAIQKSIFLLNIKSFTESTHHNSCLNRKVSIDEDGNIKNCPSMLQTFGNIKDTTLQDALDHTDFKKYWSITKDQIDICRDCEFRYICTDCRAYIEEPEDVYSKPLKCGYNPYAGVWEDWSTHPIKQKAIDYYGMREVLIEFEIKPDYASTRSNLQ